MVDEVYGVFAKLKQQGKIEFFEGALKNHTIEEVAQFCGMSVGEIESILNSKF